MESFEIRWRSSTKKDLRSLPRQEVARVVSAVGELAANPLPHGSQKLSGSERTYRVRVGDYRVIYEVLADSRIVEIQRVKHRKDVYRE
ncbi:MAG: type II toxin-antitoxin system RelE/ParE family toxin [Chthoniobacteraceae bacterium]